VETKEELRERNEATGDEDAFVGAKRLYERALAEEQDAQLLIDYGYQLYCHIGYTIGRAVEQYERAIELDPDADKAHYRLIAAKAALGDADEAVALYERRLAAAPDDLRRHRLMASAYLAAGEPPDAHAEGDASPDSSRRALFAAVVISVRMSASLEMGCSGSRERQPPPTRPFSGARPRVVPLGASDVWPRRRRSARRSGSRPGRYGGGSSWTGP
jgi:tetratricopeptide (TPR) repeat protein